MDAQFKGAMVAGRPPDVSSRPRSPATAGCQKVAARTIETSVGRKAGA
jgi:hypothetical protein